MDDPFVIYKSWPVETVKDALDEFKRQMYSGASSTELRAGLLCFDFLIKRTELPRVLLIMIQAAIDEANIRADLMDEVDAIAMDNEQARKALEQAVASIKVMERTMTRVMERARNMDYETVQRHVRQAAEYWDKYGH